MSGSELPPLIGGRYQPLRLIGRGGMGLVYEVEHAHTGERLALKVLVSQSHASGASVDRFKREARASARIKSENVVRVIDADVAPELDGAPYLVMELLEGADLERAAGSQPQTPALVVEWLDQIARPLDKAHRLGIVHRDLKPENLFLTRRDDGSVLVKILDFGIAKMTAEQDAATQSGQMLGTPWYMAPEQADGGAITAKTDLFSLGLIAYRLITGGYYWRGRTLPELLNELLYKPMPPPSERGVTLGAAFDGWFARACERDAAKRFASATELVAALADALGVARRASIVAPPTATPSGNELESRRAISGDELESRRSFEHAPTLEASASVITATSAPRRRPRAAIVVLVAVAAIGGAFAFVVMGREASTRATGSASAPPLTASSAPLASSSSIAAPQSTPSANAAVASPAPLADASAAPSAAVSPARAQPRAAPTAKPSAKPSAAPVHDPLADQK